MTFSLLDSFLIVLLIALVVTVVFRLLKLPVILGYLVVGAMVGPHALAWLDDTKAIKELAEFGVVLLMFTVGLEFSLAKLYSLRKSVFILGTLQVLISIGISILIGLYIGMDLPSSIVVGCVIAMSSTAIVVKQLSEQLQIKSKSGMNAIGILLFQDLAVIPILVMIASLSGSSDTSFSTVILWSLLKGVLVVFGILALGRWLLQPLFRMIAATRVIELFTLTVLFIAIGAAWLTAKFGLSYALGATLAGIMLGETEYRHQIMIEIRPFRDVLLGLFFITIGMLVNVTVWPQTWHWILLLLVALMIGKSVLITLLCRITKVDLVSATRTGLILAQGGEFGFAILILAIANQLLPLEWGQTILASLLISFGFAPIIIRNNKAIAKFIFPRVFAKSIKKLQHDVSSSTAKLSEHVIICGYGRVGQNIARFLDKVKCPYIGLDLDPEVIINAKSRGETICYGNASHIDILTAAKLNKAKAIIISFDDVGDSISLLEHVRNVNKTIPILARCKDESEFALLQNYGATMIVAEIFEESMTLAHHLLHLIQIPQHEINDLLQFIRDENYQMLSE